jgi:uncharacterized protein YciI
VLTGPDHEREDRDGTECDGRCDDVHQDVHGARIARDAKRPVNDSSSQDEAVFVLLLTYVQPLDEVDRLMRRHMAWLNEHYDAGRFVVSGRRIPRTGGVILARGDDRAEIEAIAASDPFVAGGVATCEVVEFRASQIAEDLRGLL